MRIDSFFEKQPPISFVDSLREPVHMTPPVGFGSGVKKCGEVSADGMYIAEKFPDDGGLLDTAYADFKLFLEICKISGDAFPIYVRRGEVLDYESYRIETVEKECTVTAEDTEGVRRALVYLEGELTKREGAFLPLGKIERKPYIKARITRGFFSPTNRAPKFGDELLDDIDYYPDEYLNRLAHSNTNGLWIYTSFRALVCTPYFNDDKQKAAKRIEKLRKVVKKCKKYGVKVYIFAIEPLGLNDEEAATHPELMGGGRIAPARWNPTSWNPICLRTDAAKDYLISAVEQIFRAVPDLGGYIDITAGERPTSCASVATYKSCPRCSRYSRGENLAYALDIIKEGIRRAGTGAEFISWTYGHRYWFYDDVNEYVKKAPRDVVLMQNFEDRGYTEQLGKPRVAYDYWLSYVGPSELYQKTAAATRKYGKELWAKMQVCCSHELATVPYIPAPGILFDKYCAARELGTTGVMECWYFGNYPSVMSRAAGELSFVDALEDKDSFLFDFASRIYGESLAKKVTKAWRFFEEGYINYPTNIMFSYYGPMHDGVVWELSLLPKNNSLPRSWLLPDVPDGDRIGECLFSGHTLDEALMLAARMRDNWKCGLEILPLPCDNELSTVSASIGILFDSGYNILSFYKLRSELGKEQGDARLTLEKMRNIVLSEIENSNKMAKLCKKDNRLGYHSEAEGFKFFPEKLEYRISKLESLLVTEFPEVLERIDAGRSPLGYYYAEGEETYRLGDGEVYIGEGRSFVASMTDGGISLTLKTRPGDDAAVYYEFELFAPECGVVICENDEGTIHQESLEKNKKGLRLDPNATSHQSVWGEGTKRELSVHRLESEHCDGYTIHRLYTEIPYDKWNRKTAIKMRLRIGDSLWKHSDDPVSTLGKSDFSPDEFGFITL